MRIGISALMIQRGHTGIAQYLFGLCRALQNSGTPHRFVLFCLEEDLPLFQFAAGWAEIVPVPEGWRPPLRNLLWHHLNLPRLALRHRLDLVHIPSYRRLLARSPCPRVATIHDLAPFHVPHKYDPLRMFYGRVAVHWLAHFQDRIIAISENTARDITRFFKIPRARISVIHNGLDHARFRAASSGPAGAQLAARHGLDKPFFLYVARLEHPGKNHIRLIQAFEQFKASTGSDWQLVLAGSDWHGAEAIHTARRRSLVGKDIRALGFIHEDDLPDFYRAAGAFVYPSLYEGFGMPPTEAMACGCPVICSTRGALGEIVGNSAAVVDPESIASIAGQLSAVAGSAALRQDLRTAGLAQAARFDWRHTAAATIDVYERVTGAASMDRDQSAVFCR